MKMQIDYIILHSTVGPTWRLKKGKYSHLSLQLNNGTAP
jgi:hypothetical protein